MFTDREDAGKKLASRLEEYRGNNAVVLALPRGGVVLGYEVAKALGFPLDIIATRKIGHPMHPEYAIGAIDEKGMRILNEMEVAATDPTWLAKESERQRKEAERRVMLYRGGRVPVALAGKVVILVDDGIATGLSMRLAQRTTKAQRPKKVIIAVPVAPPESVATLRAEGADDVMVIEAPEEFLGTVGAHYLQFDQVGDDVVINLLRISK